MRLLRIILIILCFGTGLILTHCTTNTQEDPAILRMRQMDSLRALKRADSVRKVQRTKTANEAIPKVFYRRTVIHDKQMLDSVRRVYGKAKTNTYRAFTTLNRKDIQFFRVGDTILIPSAIHQDLRVYSLFPHYYPAAETLDKILFVSNKYQAYACYEKGKLVRFAACNTGEEHKPTFPGRYAMNWRDKLRHSSIDSSWVLPWTWNIHLQAGSAFHQFEMPGRPVSHSCIRQFMDDAEWLFKWGKQGAIDTARRKYIPFTGTPVIILDIFDFNRKKGGSWWELTSNKDSMIVLPPDPMSVEEALIPISQIPPEVRWTLPNKERYMYAEDTLRARGWIRDSVELKESVNFNKQRREKAIAKAKVDAKKKKSVAVVASDEDVSSPDAPPILKAAAPATLALSPFGEVVKDKTKQKVIKQRAAAKKAPKKAVKKVAKKTVPAKTH